MTGAEESRIVEAYNARTELGNRKYPRIIDIAAAAKVSLFKVDKVIAAYK